MLHCQFNFLFSYIDMLTEKLTCLLVLTTITLIILILMFWRKPSATTREPFTTKRDKAQLIYTWFINNKGSESYANYKQAMDGRSNIVEYEDVLGLVTSGPPLTVESIERII